MTISFSGLASGLDTSSWVESLVKLKQAKIDTLEEEKEKVILSKETLDNIKSFFSSFRSVIEKVTDSKFGIPAMDLFAQNLAVSSNLDILTASATTEAEQGKYDVLVNQLATNTEANSTYAYMTTIVQTTTATYDSKLTHLGVKAGNIGVTVNGIERNITISENDTIKTFRDKLEEIGVKSSFNENTGVFCIDIDKDAINDIDNTGIVTALHLEGVNEGYTSDSLQTSQTDTIYSAATASTLMSELGAKNGIIQVHANDADYQITINDTTTLGSFINDLKSNNIDARLDNNGVLTISDARITNEGTTNILDALGLDSDIYSNTQISGELSHKSIVITSTEVTSNTLLKDLGEGINITNGQTVILKNSNNEYSTITVGTGTTVGKLLSDITNTGIYAELNSEGKVEISGGTITGGTFDVINALKLTSEPFTAMTTGKPLTETVETFEAVTLDTKLVDDLKVRAGYIEVTDSNGQKFYEKIYHGQTLADFMSDMGNLGIYTKLREDSVLEITGGAFATLSDDRVKELINNGTIRETDDRYKQGTDILTCLYGSPVISTDQISVASTYSKSRALTYSVVNTINASTTTTLGNLSLNQEGTVVFNVRGENRTINVTKSMSIDGLMTALQNVGISSIWDADSSRLTIENAVINGGSSNLASILNLSTTVSGKYTSSNILYARVREVADNDSRISDFITLPASKTLVIHDEIGTNKATVSVSSTMTFDELFKALGNHGVQGSISNGVVTFTSNNGSYVTGDILKELGMSSVLTTITVTTTVGTSSSGSAFHYTTTQDATGSTTFAQIGSGGNKSWRIMNGQTGTEVASGSFADNTTIGEFLNILGQYGFSGSIDGGFVTISSPQGYYVTGTAADALGLTTYNYTMSVHGTGTNTISATDTFTIDQTRTITSSGFVTVSSSDTVVVDITTVSSVNTSGYVTVTAKDTIVVDVTRTVNTSSSGVVTIHAKETITVDVTKTLTVTSTGTTTVTVSDTATVKISQTISANGSGSTVITNSTVVTMTVAQTLTTTITTTSAATETLSSYTFASKSTTAGSIGVSGNYIINGKHSDGKTFTQTISISSSDSIETMIRKLNNNEIGVIFDFDETNGSFYVYANYENSMRWGLDSSSASKLKIYTQYGSSGVYAGVSSSGFYTTRDVTTVVNKTSTISTTSTVSVAVTKTIVDTFTVALDTTGSVTVDVTRTYTVSDTQTVSVTTSGTTTVNIKQTLAIDATQTITVSTSGTNTINIKQTLTISATSTEKVDTTGSVTVNVKQTLTINTTSTERVNTTGTVNISQTVTVTAHQTITVDVTSTRTVTANKSSTDHNEYSTGYELNGNTQLRDIGMNAGTVSGVYNGEAFTVTINNMTTIDGFAAQLAAYGIETSVSNGSMTFKGTSSGYITNTTGSAAMLGAKSAYTTKTSTTVEGFNTNSGTQDRTITNSATLSTKLNQLTSSNGTSLGITSGSIYVYQDGTRYLVNINNDDTLQTLSSKLAQYGITMNLASDGKIYFDGNNNSYMTTQGLTSGASNILQKLNVDGNWNTRYDSTSNNLKYTVNNNNKISGETKLSELQDKDGNNLGISEGAFYVYNKGVRTTETITADMTVNDLMAMLAKNGFVADISEDGSISIGAHHNSYLAASATAGANSNIVSTLFSEWNFVNIYTSNNLEIPEDKIVAVNRDTKLKDINEGIYKEGLITVVKDGIQTNITLTEDDTIGTLMDTLSLYGFESVINEKGQLILKNTGNSLLQNYAGTGASNALEILGIDLNNWIQTNTYEGKPLDVIKTSTIDASATRDTELSLLGVTTGEYFIYNNGVKYTAYISTGETLGSFLDTLKSFGIETSLVTNGDKSVLTIIGAGDSYITKSTSTTDSSNVVEKLFGNTDHSSSYKYTGLEQTSEIVTTFSAATEETLLSYFNKPWGADTLKAEGTLSVNINGENAKIEITQDETFGSLLDKFKALGLEAAISSDGEIMIQSGYNTFTINTDGTTSSLLATIGLTYKQDLGGFAASSDTTKATTTLIEEKTFSVANYAALDTKMGLLNISDGSLSIYKNGQKATIQVKKDETFGDLRARISAAFSDVDITFENGYLKFFSKTEGDSIEVGATTDTSNISAICGLINDGSGAVKSARELFCVNSDSIITNSGLFRKGDVTEGSFIVGNATFNISNNTRMADLIAQINASDEANATAYWDSIDGSLVIKSRTTGSALINIEAGTSNFTDIMGFTNTDRNADGSVDTTKMNISVQHIGNNAKFSINGTTYTSNSNNITSDISRIKGLTINLKGLTDGSAVTLTVERDKETLANAVSEIVDSYNELIKNVDEAIAKDGKLHNQSVLKILRNQIRNLMTSSDAGTTVFRNLDAIGICAEAAKANNISTAGITTLTFDKDKFIKAFEADEDALKALLIGSNNNTGVLTKIEDLVESSLKSVTGFFDTAENSYQKQVNKIENKIERQKKALERYRAQLEAKFASMDILIANMQQQYSSFLTT